MQQECFEIVEKMETKLQKELFERREQGESHAPYEKELLVLECVRSGNYHTLCERMGIQKQEKIGKMSENILRQKVYELITWATMVTRFAVEGGLNLEIAYTLSDLYIRETEKLKDIAQIECLRQAMTWDFAYRVFQSKGQKNGYSKPVSRAMEYIQAHLHRQLSLKEIADRCQISPQYLCTLFEQETNCTVFEFIRKERIEEACTLLCSSELSGMEIAAGLGFGTQSYFIECFKKEKQCTPNQYRKKYFRKRWNKENKKEVSEMELKFRPVDELLKPQVLALKTTPEQKGFIESVADCLQEASRRTDWKPVGIFDGKTLVGFAMYGYFWEYPPKGRVWLDRLLIDSCFQNKGYGKAAAKQLTEKLLQEYNCDAIYLSVVQGNTVAQKMYESLGYCINGEKDENGEDVMVFCK